MFTAEGSGTEPLNYQWEWKQAMDDGEWQPCDGERFPGADSSRLAVLSVQKSDEGNYHCVISNCAGKETSNPAQLSVGKNLTITGNIHCVKYVSSLFFIFYFLFYFLLLCS